MKRMRWAAAGVLLLAAGNAWANNLVVTNVVASARDTNTAFVAFDLSWENAWRDTNVNHDAAWVFFKVRRQGETAWTNHVVLEGTGTNPPGYSGGTGTAIEMIVPTDKVGLFVRRSQQGAGNVAVTGVKAVWNIASSGMASASMVEMTACALEMVYVAEGSFEAGDGQGGRSQYTKTLINTGDPTVAPSGSPLAGGYPSGGEAYPAAAAITTNWPNGYKAFYCMKYEITQGQYADFLNTLTSGQAATRTIQGEADYTAYRGTIGGTWPNHTVSAPDRACGFLSWADGAAFADWAGLRPMTELEFEKACRGPTPAVAGEYAWGNATAPTAITSENNDGQGTSTANPSSANCCYNNQLQGPCRAGIFATDTSTREQAGASYWGIMELSGNLWERTVTIASADDFGAFNGGRFTGLHGDGKLNGNGDASVTAWPATDASGAVIRGGNWGRDSSYARVSDRTFPGGETAPRYGVTGWRGVRSAP